MCWRTEKCARSNAKKKKKKKKKVKEEVRVSIIFLSTLSPAALRSERRENNTHTHTHEKEKQRICGCLEHHQTTPRANAIAHEHQKRKNAPNPLTFKNAGNSSNLSFIVLIGFVRSPSYKQRKFPPPSSSPPCAVGFVDGMMYFLSHSK